jgi:hypothetical protein
MQPWASLNQLWAEEFVTFRARHQLRFHAHPTEGDSTVTPGTLLEHTIPAIKASPFAPTATNTVPHSTFIAHSWLTNTAISVGYLREAYSSSSSPPLNKGNFPQNLHLCTFTHFPHINESQCDVEGWWQKVMLSFFWQLEQTSGKVVSRQTKQRLTPPWSSMYGYLGSSPLQEQILWVILSVSDCSRIILPSLVRRTAQRNDSSSFNSPW